MSTEPPEIKHCYCVPPGVVIFGQHCEWPNCPSADLPSPPAATTPKEPTP